MKLDPKKRLSYLPLFAAVTAVTPLAIDMYLPAMPAIAASLQTNITLIQNSLSVFLFSYALGMFLFGPLADRIGRKAMLLIGLAGYCLFSGMIAMSDSGNEFLIFRVLQAMFGGAATLVIPGTIRLLFGKDTVKGLSYVSSIMMIAPMLAPSLGGLVLSLSNWRMIFILLAVYSGVIFSLSYRFFPLSEKIESVPMPLHQVYFSSYQRIFTTENIRCYLLISMLASFTFFTYITGVAFVYIKVLHFSELTFGLVFGINVLVLMSSNFINSKLTPIYGEKTLLSYYWGIAILFSSALMLSVFLKLPWIFILLSLIPLMGCLMAIIISADSIILQAFSQFTGTATAVIGTLRFTSGALAGPLLALLYDGSAKPFALLIFSGVIAIGLVQYLNHNH